MLSLGGLLLIASLNRLPCLRDQLFQRHTDRPCKPFSHFERGESLSALQHADVVARYVRSFGELLLRNSLPESVLPDNLCSHR